LAAGLLGGCFWVSWFLLREVVCKGDIAERNLDRDPALLVVGRFRWSGVELAPTGSLFYQQLFEISFLL
jgi:hypothetical protein